MSKRIAIRRHTRVLALAFALGAVLSASLFLARLRAPSRGAPLRAADDAADVAAARDLAPLVPESPPIGSAAIRHRVAPDGTRIEFVPAGPPFSPASREWARNVVGEVEIEITDDPEEGAYRRTLHVVDGSATLSRAIEGFYVAQCRLLLAPGDREPVGYVTSLTPTRRADGTIEIPIGYVALHARTSPSGAWLGAAKFWRHSEARALHHPGPSRRAAVIALPIPKRRFVGTTSLLLGAHAHAWEELPPGALTDGCVHVLWLRPGGDVIVDLASLRTAAASGALRRLRVSLRSEAAEAPPLRWTIPAEVVGQDSPLVFECLPVGRYEMSIDRGDGIVAPTWTARFDLPPSGEVVLTDADFGTAAPDLERLVISFDDPRRR
jgi:hypothetical protein